jgi:glycosyltransferase involved in cell wall biosynthesis
MGKLKILMLGESLDRQGGIVSVEKLIIAQAPAEIEIGHLATLPNGNTINKIVVFVQAIGSLCWRLSQQEIDIIHIHVSERGSAFRQAITTTIGWLFRKPVIIHTHSAEFREFYADLSPIVKTGLSWAFGRSTRFIVLSQSWQKFYIENLGLPPERVVVLPNPVKLPRSIPDRTNAKRVNLLFLGRIGDRKGAFDLINAVAAMPPAQQEHTHLTIAGDGEGKRARDLISDLNLTARITILDWVNEQQRDELLGQAHVFILPSYNEGLPMALLEAMSWGLPVITTPVGGIPELVIPGTNGLLVDPGDIAGLSAALQSLAGSEQLRLQLGNAARATVMPFEISKYFSQLADVYMQCSSERPYLRIEN